MDDATHETQSMLMVVARNMLATMNLDRILVVVNASYVCVCVLVRGIVLYIVLISSYGSKLAYSSVTRTINMGVHRNTALERMTKKKTTCICSAVRTKRRIGHR